MAKNTSLCFIGPRKLDVQRHFPANPAVQLTLQNFSQLVTIRLAQECGTAPERARGKGEQSPIPNQRPIATQAATTFYEDLTVFLRAYATIPRLSLVSMLETCLAINLTNIFLSSMRMLERWIEKGYIPEESQEEPWPLFVDCSLSTDHTLRQLAEQSMDACRRRLPRLATTLMYLRLLDYQVRYDSDIPAKDLPPRAPDATAWLNLLGDIAQGSHEESQQINRFFRRKARELADALESDDPNSLSIDMLRGDDSAHSAGWRLAEALISLMGTDRTTEQLQKFFNSCLMPDEPNGIARRRRIRLRNVTAGQKISDVASSFVLSNTALEFLVHRYLRSSGKGHKAVPLSFPGFLRLLRERYGLYIDQAPPDLPIPNDMLLRNRQILERRLRDLGLLVGVNDAETMKRLHQRFVALGDMEIP